MPLNTRSQSSKQHSFASNLNGTPLGVALYSPLPFDSSSFSEVATAIANVSNERVQRQSGKVGDIAFFNRDGKYQWVRNAFDVDVNRSFCVLIYRDFGNGIGQNIRNGRKPRCSKNSRVIFESLLEVNSPSSTSKQGRVSSYRLRRGNLQV